MVITVTLNPAIDYIVSPETFKTGRINRYSSCTYKPGGKGINVSLLLTSLGVKNLALGVAAGFSGREILRLLRGFGCDEDFLFLEEGHSRINVKVCASTGEETDLSGEGPSLPQEVLLKLAEQLSRLGEEDVLVLAGTVPASLGRDAYATLLRAVEGKGVKIIVDAQGDVLRSALPFHPYLVKPNLEELGELFGTTVQGVGQAAHFGRALQDLGAQNVVVSMGEKGALLLEKGGTPLFCLSPRGETVSTVGAGDSLVAGLIYGEALHGSLKEALPWGVAAGAATAFQKGIASGEAVKGVYPRVTTPYPLGNL